jgi:nucleotide-binding universal stress UspA family protein
MPAKKMLVTTDLSPESETALDAALELAAALGSGLTLLHVLDFSMALPAGALILSPQQDLNMRGEIREKVLATLERLKDTRLAAKGGQPVAVEPVTVEGAGVAHTICSYAEEHGMDMIVIASHGRTGLPHLLIGSVAERVVRHARCAVLVVPTHERN